MDYDIIIVGGRVAGSILATQLGQFGFRVLLLEKADIFAGLADVLQHTIGVGLRTDSPR